MIISASRRTDIPAFYSDWFLKRIQEGFVQVRNPMNANQVSLVSLKREDVDMIVFWTKNPKPIIPKLEILDQAGYSYYFQFTITPYGKEIERNLPTKEELMDTFITLSQKIGKERVIWRYDPIMITDSYSQTFHLTTFEKMCHKLAPYTNRVVISFLDVYGKTKRKMGNTVAEVSRETMKSLAYGMSQIANQYGLAIESCSEPIDLTEQGIKPTACIDLNIIESLIGRALSLKKDKNQRKTCHCVQSVDIGAYDSCLHDCLYCYATGTIQFVKKNASYHKKEASFLIGKAKENDIVTERK